MKKVYVSDIASVEATLTEANGRLERSVKVEDVIAAVRSAEALLTSLGLNAAAKREVSITVNPERNRQPKAKSYGFSAQAVQVELKMNTTGWYVVSAERKFALSDTKAHARDSFVNIPDELFTKAAAATALGIKITDIQPRIILAQEEVLEMEWHVPCMPDWDDNEEECLAAFEKFHNVSVKGTARDVFLHCAEGVYSDN